MDRKSQRESIYWPKKVVNSNLRLIYNQKATGSMENLVVQTTQGISN